MKCLNKAEEAAADILPAFEKAQGFGRQQGDRGRHGVSWNDIQITIKREEE